jgi:hypothetical protein
MVNTTFDALVAENRILRNQQLQSRYFLVGSRATTLHIQDVELNQTIHCSSEDIHKIAAGFLQPARSCIDIGPGLRPQRLLDCPLHLLVEPYLVYAEKLVAIYPEKITVVADGVSFLKSVPDRSVDTVFLLDVIEHLDKDDGQILFDRAMKAARRQVVVFTPLGFMPQHFSQSVDWDGVVHSELQNHRSGWDPSEFSNAVHIVCEDYHRDGGTIYGAFYSIVSTRESSKPRLILISDGQPQDFEFLDSDVLIADVMFSELSWKISAVPKSNLTIVPLQLIAEESGTDKSILRSTVINFAILEHYLKSFSEVIALGLAADTVLQRHRNGWN